MLDEEVFNETTAIIWAATRISANKELIEWLLIHGANPAIQDALGRTFDKYLSPVILEGIGFSLEQPAPESPTEPTEVAPNLNESPPEQL
ncbi:MAG: ankyrin repeat domain-containing protein [Nanoarchaeota archaeon]|nr:ankyrin repeat domain-containing protein [Nanoarchaeota archaeon]